MGVNSPAAAAVAAAAAAASASSPGRSSVSPASRGHERKPRSRRVGRPASRSALRPRAPRPAGRPPSSPAAPSPPGPPPSAAAMGTDSRAAGALLARARTLHLQTGNLLNWGRLRKKCPSTHSEEVRDAGLPGQAAGPGGSQREAAPGGTGGRAGSGRRVRRAPGLRRRGEAGAAGVATSPPNLQLRAARLQTLAGAASSRGTPPSVLPAASRPLERTGPLFVAGARGVQRRPAPPSQPPPASGPPSPHAAAR